jgi:hypothetical protein
MPPSSFVTAGRSLLAITGHGFHHARHAAGTGRAFLDLWDLEEAPIRVKGVRPAHKQG